MTIDSTVAKIGRSMKKCEIIVKILESLSVNGRGRGRTEDQIYLVPSGF